MITGKKLESYLVPRAWYSLPVRSLPITLDKKTNPFLTQTWSPPRSTTALMRCEPRRLSATFQG